MLRVWVLVTGVMGLAAGCVTSAWAAELTQALEPRWQGAAIAVPSGEVTNAQEQVLRFTRVAALVSGVALHRADGSVVRLDGQFGLWDVERGWTAVTLRGVPQGKYVGLEFQIGLPAEVNHGDPAQWPAGHPLNPLVNGLHWSWQGGYVFFALEGRWRERDAAATERVVELQANGVERGFLYHLATDARRVTVRFAAEFAVESDGGTTVRLALELARVLWEWRLVAGGESESTHSSEGDEVARRLAVEVERAWFWLGADVGVPALTRRATAERGVRELEGRRVRDNAPYPFVVPAGFPQPELPADNPLTAEGVELGRRLFSDTRLSGNGTQSCASCHAPERAFSDTVALSRGAEGTLGRRNAMPLFNLAWSSTYAWDGSRLRVRDQALAALRNPIEMNGDVARVSAALAEDDAMRAGFAAAFGDEAVTGERIGRALEQYLLTLVDGDSRFDRALRGEGELTEEEKRGFELFVTEYDPARGRRGADCFHCHGGVLFTDFGFKNNGLGVAGGDRGREGVSGRARDRGKFKTPSLRNVALTAPYMHDGRFATLEEVVAHYDHGVERSATLDVNLAKHPAEGMRLGAEEQRALVAFLRTLTDPRYERGAKTW